MSPASYLIVGANRGIGLGLVEETLKLYPDASVYAVARDPAKATELNALAKASAGRLVVLKADMLDEPSLEAAVKELKTHTSSISTAIFNAGILRGKGPLGDLAASEFLDNLNGNVVGPHNLFKAFGPFLLASDAPTRTIACISSLAGSITNAHGVADFLTEMFGQGYSPLGGYNVTKAALNMLGRQWAEVLEPQGVAVALIHPGAVATDMNDGVNLITVKESATSILSQLAGLKLETTATGIISYDGSVIPW